MGRLAALRATGGLLWIAASMVAHAAPHPVAFGPGSAPHSPEIMLYFSHAIGGGVAADGPSRPTFGLRLQQVHQAANSGDPEAGDAMQHRELVNWQLQAHSNLRIADMQVRLGNRVTYDLTSRRFGSPSRAAMPIGIPSRLAVSPPSAPRPTVARRSFDKDNSSIRDSAVAVMAALSPARFTTTRRQPSQRQGGIAGIAATPPLRAVRSTN